MSTKVSRIQLTLAAGILAALLLGSLPATAASKDKVNEKYRANAIVTGAIGPGASTVVDIKISRWTTDDEREDLIKALEQMGPDRLRSDLRKQKKAGFFQVRGETSYPIFYAREIQQGDKRFLILVSPRQFEFTEVYRGDNSQDFQFTVVQLEVDAEGNGSGAAIVGAEIVYDEAENQLKIQNYDTAPVRLEAVRSLKK